MPAQGLFYERNKTNFFNGIWRIPVDEIDRPGSFASHMNRSIVLLLKVLSKLKDHHTLLKISSMLQRTPDQGKKYLRDADRQVLAQRAFVLTVTVLEDILNELAEVSKDPDSAGCSLPGSRMTTDVSHKASAEDGQEALPKKAPLADGAAVAYGAGNGAKEPQPPIAMDVEVKAGAEVREAPPPGPAEPMDFIGQSSDSDKPGCPECAHAPPGKVTKEKASEYRTAELSLEDLSISSRHQQLEAVKVRVQAAPGEEVCPRPSRKRKLTEDAESGKTLLLDAYRVWQQGQKVMTYDLGKIEKIMSETYMLIKQVDEEAALEQAVKFCQVHIAASAQKQSAGETPTTPKHSRDGFFPAAPASLATADPIAAEALLRLTDPQTKPKTASLPPASSSSSSAGVLLLLPPPPPPTVEQVGAERMDETPPISSLAQEEGGEGKPDRPPEGQAFLQQPQESRLCQQMQVPTIALSLEPSPWPAELETGTGTGSGQVCSQAPSSKADVGSGSPPAGSQASKADSSSSRGAKPRLLPNMPKLFIPLSITKFPPEITVTPPTPTLLSPKGSISEETKQKLKSAILSAQSAANVKKESLCQPALEIVETSSQESSLESDTDEEDDCMDV